MEAQQAQRDGGEAPRGGTQTMEAALPPDPNARQKHSEDERTDEGVGKRERTKAANRRAILEAARRVFAQLGYETATVRDIIRATDLAAGTFYNYFKSKEEVFEALADDGARRFRPLLRSAREQAGNFEDFLWKAVRAYFTFLLEEHGGPGQPISKRGPPVRADTPEMIAVYEEVRDGVAHAIARGLAPALDADFLSAAIIGAAQEVGKAMLAQPAPEPEKAARFVVQLVLGGAPAAAEKEARP
jgi:AcrR family transcriptional regulator